MTGTIDPERLHEVDGPEYKRAFAADDREPAELSAPSTNGHGPPGRINWRRYDLADVDAAHVEPEILRDSTGRAIGYRGALTLVFSPFQSGKGWLLVLGVLQEIAAGGTVTYVDAETSERLMRARLDTVDPELHRNVGYWRPTERLVGDVRELAADLVVYDGVTELCAMHGLNANAGEDVAKLYNLLGQPLAADGSAVFFTDHVPNDPEAQHRAIGSQHKQAGVDVAYRLQVVKKWAKAMDDPREGLVRVICAKDRFGTFEIGETVAELAVTAWPDGGVSLSLEPPTANTDAAGNFRPTVLMERVSRYLEELDAPCSKNQIMGQVRGKESAKAAALDRLVSEGYVHSDPPEKRGGAYAFRSLHPFRPDTDEGSAQPPPTSSRVEAGGTSAPSAPSIQIEGGGRNLLGDVDDQGSAR